MGRHTLTTPYRKAKRHWRLIALIVVAAASFVAANYALLERGYDLNDVIYQQCVANEVQDAVIVDQLQAAKRRVNASLPRWSAERIYQLSILNDGIQALEPPGENECEPPDGTEP